jgi:hypothetical protein
VIVLGFDHDHRHLRATYETAGELVCRWVLNHAFLQPPSAPIPELPPLPSAPLLPRDPWATALLQALPLLGRGVPAQVARAVAGIPGPEFRRAMLALQALGWIAARDLRGEEGIRCWQYEAIITLPAPGVAIPFPPPDDAMRARWNEQAEAERVAIDRVRSKLP